MVRSSKFCCYCFPSFSKGFTSPIINAYISSANIEIKRDKEYSEHDTYFALRFYFAKILIQKWTFISLIIVTPLFSFDNANNQSTFEFCFSHYFSCRLSVSGLLLFPQVFSYALLGVLTQRLELFYAIIFGIFYFLAPIRSHPIFAKINVRIRGILYQVSVNLWCFSNLYRPKYLFVKFRIEVYSRFRIDDHTFPLPSYFLKEYYFWIIRALSPSHYRSTA